MRNYFHLQLLADELKFIKDFKIIEIFSQEKNILIFRLVSNSSEIFLHFSSDPVSNSLFFKSEFFRAKKNSADLFPELINQSVNTVQLIKNERIIKLEFKNFNLYFLMFGASKSNCILTDGNLKIINAFKNSSELKNNLFNNYYLNQNFSSELFLLKKQLGKDYLNEILNNSIKDNPVSDDLLLNEMKSFINERINNHDKILILENEYGQRRLSLTELLQYPIQVKDFSKINDAVSFLFFNQIKDRNTSGLKIQLTKKTEFILEKTIRKIAGYQDNVENSLRSEKYRLWGELLSSRSDIKEKAGTSIKVLDWEGIEHIIPLKENLTLLQNSIKYLEKSSNIKKNIDINKQSLPALKRKKENLEILLELIKKAEKFKELEKIMKDNKDIFSTGESENEVSKFRKFDLGEGFVLYVGKNAANNDELTMKFAKANDLWFHARGTSGSHAVLKNSGSSKPGKIILQKAAAIAAYYSGSRNAGLIPVAYTLKKFIHKPRGANPGAVVLSREEVIMVRPGLPENSNSDV